MDKRDKGDISLLLEVPNNLLNYCPKTDLYGVDESGAVLHTILKMPFF